MPDRLPTPDDFVTELPASLRRRAAAIRRLAFELAPHAAERVTWDALSIYDPDRGGPIKGSICQIVLRRGVLRLDFPLGEFMEDPSGLLLGQPGRKGKRFVEINATSPSDLEIQALIRASLAGPPKPKRLADPGP